MEVLKESKDLVEKYFEAFPDVAADIVNALLYDGEKTVNADSLMPAPTETLYSGEGTGGRLRSQYEDLAKYEMRAGRIHVIYQFANQSAVDGRMILRKAGYTGGVYREQYEGKLRDICPVVELVLYWGKKRWGGFRSILQLFDRRELSPKLWQYIDDLKLHVWEMRSLPVEVRQRFTSDMRIVVDYLAEGDCYCSDRPVVHKEALVKMIRVLSGDDDVEDTAEVLRGMNIREEDEITVCELFDQYTRKGLSEGLNQGIEAAIAICRELGLSFEVTAEKIKEKFRMGDAEVQKSMKRYW